MRRPQPFLLSMLVLALTTSPSAAQRVVNTSYTAPDGMRVLRHEVVVPASVEQVWQAFTTSDGMRSWAAPYARLDYRLGGIFESGENPDAKPGDPGVVRQVITSYLPPRMISFHLTEAPPGFPAPEVVPDVFTVVQLDPAGPKRTRVTLSSVGYRSGEAFDRAYSMFAQGNPFYLQMLYRRFHDGPIDWRTVATTHEH
jgi:uncharacterized protein YndB with AHSA1/START domain